MTSDQVKIRKRMLVKTGTLTAQAEGAVGLSWALTRPMATIATATIACFNIMVDV